jgi:hypothetical protein
VNRRTALAALCLGASACATAPRPRPPDQPAPPLAELMEALRRRQAALRTIELETRTTSWLSGERVRATVPMLVDRVGRLRFEAEIPIQGSVAALVVRGREFAYLDQQHQVFHSGPACPSNVGRLIPIPLLPDEIAAILLGDAPLGASARGTEVSWDGHRQADVLAVERAGAGAAATRLWITLKRAPAPAGYDVLAVEGESPGAPGRWRVAYEDFSRAGGFALPGIIRFAEPGRSFDDGVEVKVRERLGLNRPLRDEAFVLTPPPGYRIEPLPCVGGLINSAGGAR